MNLPTKKVQTTRSDRKESQTTIANEGSRKGQQSISQLTQVIIFPVRFDSSLFRHRLRLFGFSARLADWKFFLFFADPLTTENNSIDFTTTLLTYERAAILRKLWLH